MKARNLLLAVAAAILGSALGVWPADAQQRLMVTLQSTAVTVGTTAASCAPADTQRLSLLIFNASATAKLSYTIDGTTPVSGAAGTKTIGPLSGDYFPPNGVPRNGITCISDTASTPVTVTVGY